MGSVSVRVDEAAVLCTERYFLLMRQNLFYFSGAGKFCLAHGLRQLTQDAKSDVSCLQTTFRRLSENLQMTFGVGRHTA